MYQSDLEFLEYFSNLVGQKFSSISDEHKAAFLDLKHRGLVICVFPGQRIALTDEGQRILDQYHRDKEKEEEEQARQEQQRKLDEEKNRKAARHNLWKKIGYGIATALAAPLLAFFGDKILSAFVLVVPKVIEFFKNLFHVSS